MRNDGTTCWFNAAIQMVLHIFHEVIAHVSEEMAIDLSSEAGLHDDVVRLVWRVMKRMSVGDLVDVTRRQAIVRHSDSQLNYWK